MIIAVVKNTFIDHKWNETMKYLISFTIGIVVASIISMTLLSLNFENYFMLGLAGFFAFSAFLLPGISGSLVLVMLESILCNRVYKIFRFYCDCSSIIWIFIVISFLA